MIKYLSISIWCMTLSFSMSVQGQTVWSLPPAVSDGIGGATYITDMQLAAFVNNTTIVYYPDDGSEPFAAELSGYGDLPAGWTALTAIAKWDESSLMLFNGAEYMLLNINEPSLQYVGAFPGMPASWGGSFDAASQWIDSQLLFFKGTQYVIYDKNTREMTAISDVTNFQGWDPSWTRIDAVINKEDGYLYFFHNNGYQQLNMITQAFEGGVIQMSAPRSSYGAPPVVSVNTTSNYGSPPVVQNTVINNPSTEVIESKQEERAVVDTSGWCLTGTPPENSRGEGLIEHYTPAGGDKGLNSEDNVTAGTRVAEIRVWGSYVINGIQTVLQNQEGTFTELPILGSEKGRMQVYKVPEGSCITGVKGTSNGSYGLAIHDLTITTTNGSSQRFGKRGSKPFNIKIPNNTSFYGFKVASDTKISGISLKYVGYESDIPEDEEDIASQEDAIDAQTASDSSDFKAKYRGEYFDEYVDYVDKMNTESTGFSNLIAISGIDAMGKGVNFLELDPIDISSTIKNKSIFNVLIKNKGGGPNNKFQMPYGFDYGIVGQGGAENQERFVEDSSDYIEEFSKSISVEGGTPKGGGSLSQSYTDMTSGTLGTSHIYLAMHTERKIHKFTSDPYWISSEGKRRLQLDYSFRAVIDELPVPSSFPIIPTKSIKKGKSLPSVVRDVEAAYMEVINRYGTHYISEATLGGRYVTTTRISKEYYIDKRESTESFKASVVAETKKANAGGSYGTDESDGSSTGSSFRSLDKKTYISGAAGQTVLADWSKDLENNPVPIDVTLRGNYEFLTKIFWPNDSKIDKKRELLRMITMKYIADNAVIRPEKKGDFFGETFGESAIRYTVENFKIENVRADEIDNDSEIYGRISAQWVVPGKGTSQDEIWKKGASNALSIDQGRSSSLGGVSHTTVNTKLNTRGGKLQVFANFKEEDTGDDDSFGGLTKEINLSEITNNRKSYSIEFEYDGDEITLSFEVRKTETILGKQ